MWYVNILKHSGTEIRPGKLSFGVPSLFSGLLEHVTPSPFRPSYKHSIYLAILKKCGVAFGLNHMEDYNALNCVLLYVIWSSSLYSRPLKVLV